MTATMTIDSSVAARKARWRQFLSPNAKPGFLFFVNYPDPDAALPSLPYRWPDKADERIEFSWRHYEWQLRKTGWIHDDRVPYLDNTTGTEIFAEALGCSVERPDDTVPYALACAHNVSEAAKVNVPELSQSSLAYLFDMADELYRRGGPDSTMKLIDVQSPMDVAALVWKKEDLFVAMVAEPGAVKELAAKCRAVMIAFFDEWFRRYGTEYICHYPEYFMSGGLTLSEDEIGAVNPDMMREFFVPELEALSSHYDGLGIHCCADSQHQWDNFSSLKGLRILNFVTPPGRDDVDYMNASFTHFGNDLAYAPSWCPAGDPLTWPDQLPDNIRIVLQASAANREEAIALTEALNEHPKRFRG